MAVIDPNDDCVVIRVVYDGAPMAGKTTSVATLGRGLGAGVYSPADHDGRTLYFDWLDYTGGLFEGRRIRCQIISVPGQATLAPRRRRLLQSADAVVFVGDSSPASFAADRRYLGALRGVLKDVSGPPVGIVFQANKRDLPDATPLDRLRAMLGELQLRSAIVESVAVEGAGIREAFVFAVRLALDRVRELMRKGALSTARPKINSADDLLQELQQAEAGALDLAIASGRLEHTPLQQLQGSSSLASQALHEAMQSNVDSPDMRAAAPADHAELPAIPDEKVASGLVWPPVDGRTILHETARAVVNLQRTHDGGWLGIVNDRWSLHSAAAAVFDDIEAGRAELVQWARMHAINSDVISKQRCIVLANDGRNRFRLWQLVGSESSLRSRIQAALLGDTRLIASALLSSARTFMEMAERLAMASCELPLTLDTVGVSGSSPVYVGPLPSLAAAPPPQHRSAAQAIDVLMSELRFAQPTMRAHSSALLAELARIARQAGSPKRTEWHLLQRLAALT
jgi:hypothetical protein